MNRPALGEGVSTHFTFECRDPMHRSMLRKHLLLYLSLALRRTPSVTALSLHLVACSSSPEAADSGGGAGGGTGAAGGVAAQGGSAANGTQPSGGTATAGGVAAQGGSTANGTQPSGGTATAGGVAAQGGSTANGTQPSGGTGAAGGVAAQGGSAANGTQPSGGTATAGGVAAQGGSTANGTQPSGGTHSDAGQSLSIELQLGAEDAGTLLTQLVTAPTGEVYALAWTHGSIDPAGPYGAIDALIVKFNADGSRAWARQFGEMGTVAPGIAVKAWDAALTPDGELVLTGLVNGLGQFRGQALAVAYNAFVAAFSAASGEELWARVLGGADGATEAMGVEILPDGEIVIAGATSASVLVDQPSLGNLDVFLAWLSRKGEVLRARRYGGSDEEYPTAFCSREGSLFFARKAGSQSTGSTTALELTRVDATGAMLHRAALPAPERTDLVALTPTDTGVCAALAHATYSDTGGSGSDWGVNCYAPDWTLLGSIRQGTPGAQAMPQAIACTTEGACAIAGYAIGAFESDPIPTLSEVFVVTLDARLVQSGSTHFAARGPAEETNVRATAIARAAQGTLVVGGHVKGNLFAELQGKTDLFVTTLPLPGDQLPY